jgi:lipopolysaccharide transport system permease protein
LTTTKNDIHIKFKGTVFGSLWAIIYPLLFLSLYAVIYTMIYRIRVADYSNIDYVLLIFCGLVPFFGFSEALGNGVASIKSNMGLIKNTLFPIELIPLKVVLTSSVTMIVGLLMLVIHFGLRVLSISPNFCFR